MTLSFSMLRSIQVVWLAAVLACPALSSAEEEAETSAEARTGRIVEWSISVGAKLMAPISWEFIPAPVNAALTVDILRHIRIRGDFTYHVLEGVNLHTFGAGGVLVPYGKDAPFNGGLEIKLPLLLEVGGLRGETEAGDGHRDDNHWIVIGASSGIDFTWWISSKIGIRLSSCIGYLFRIDRDSSYADGYSSTADTVGFMEASSLIGVVF